MSMFRRPTEDSSDSDESDDSEELDDTRERNIEEDITGADLARAETLSSGESISVGDDGQNSNNIVNVDHHRDMMLATLLEDFYRTRAAEILNITDRYSAAVQPLAQRLFAQATSTLAAGGLLPASAVATTTQHSRQQYLAGLRSLSTDAPRQPSAMLGDEQLAVVRVGSRAGPPTSLVQTMTELATRTGNITLMPHPQNDMQLTTPRPRRSHYQSSFQEMRLLGRGGFGRVYHTYNVFDKRDYAVKKIPLSPRLSKMYHEKGHAELGAILREVETLARLDHCNVVRYHATWIEEPSPTLVPQPQIVQEAKQKLLADRPAFPSDRSSESAQSIERDVFNSPPRSAHVEEIGYDDPQYSNGIVFEADSQNPHCDAALWSMRSDMFNQQPPSSLPDSALFTDGMARRPSQDKTIDDPSCYVLHVQMSMYPMTLAQYVSPISTAQSANAPSQPTRRHCFHLLPSLRILLGILCGLQYIHASNFVHRDLKPSNIFISPFDTATSTSLPDGFYDVSDCPCCSESQSSNKFYINPRIGDFGLVTDLIKSASSTSPKSSPSASSDRQVGTEYYRPPPFNVLMSERSGRELKDVGVHDVKSHKCSSSDEKTDVYAVGVILAELLCPCGTVMERLNLLKTIQQGRTPGGLATAVDSEGWKSETEVVSIGARVERLINGMTCHNPVERWSCNSVKEEIERLLDEICP